MKLPALLLTVLIATTFGSGPAQDAAPAQPALADLGFLAGTWLGSDGSSTWESLYSSAEGGQIVGASKELKGGRTVMIDFEHFYERDGKLRMTPFPFGKRSVEFTLTSFDKSRKQAVFENPEHDFPKSFTYRRAADDQLIIALAGDMGGGPASFELDLKRQDR